MTKNIVIMTRSSKNGGFCVAGIDTRTGEWIRLVSTNSCTGGALSKNDLKYDDGIMCAPLDIVQVSVIQKQDSKYQPENYILDTTKPIYRCGFASIDEVLGLHPCEVHDFLYGNTRAYALEHEVEEFGFSLVLIEIQNLKINQIVNYAGKKKTKATFNYNRYCYSSLSVTDPDFYDVPDNTLYDHAYIVVSLPEHGYPEGCFYKFVAKIYV